jgi:hypothetical protein
MRTVRSLLKGAGVKGVYGRQKASFLQVLLLLDSVRFGGYQSTGDFLRSIFERRKMQDEKELTTV